MFRSIDLFAGIGGIRKGFDNAFGNEIETFQRSWADFILNLHQLQTLLQILKFL